MFEKASTKRKITLFMVMIPTADQCLSHTFSIGQNAEDQWPDTEPQPQPHFSSEPPTLRRSAFSSYSAQQYIRMDARCGTPQLHILPWQLCKRWVRQPPPLHPQRTQVQQQLMELHLDSVPPVKASHLSSRLSMAKRNVGCATRMVNNINARRSMRLRSRDTYCTLTSIASCKWRFTSLRSSPHRPR